MHTVLIGIGAVILYIGASLFLGLRLKNRITTPESKIKPIVGAAAAALLHMLVLAQMVFTPAGLNLGLVNAVSLVTWFISLLIIVGSVSRPVENLGIVLFPIAALAVMLEQLFSTRYITETVETTIEIHILLSVLAYSLLTIAAVQAILVAIQDNHLRNKRPGGFIRALPPLQTMEGLLFQVIALGFIMQSLSLFSGLLFIEDIFAQHLVHKTVLSVIAWLVFAILLWGRWRFGWRGRTAIRWTLSGFATLALAYLGVKVVLEIIIGV